MHVTVPGISARNSRVMPFWSRLVGGLPVPRLSLLFGSQRQEAEGVEIPCFGFQSSLVVVLFVLFFLLLFYSLRKTSSKVLVLKIPNNKTVVITEL